MGVVGVIGARGWWVVECVGVVGGCEWWVGGSGGSSGWEWYEWWVGLSGGCMEVVGGCGLVSVREWWVGVSGGLDVSGGSDWCEGGVLR